MQMNSTRLREKDDLRGKNTKKERRNTGADGGGRVGRGRGGDRRKRRVELDGNTDRRNAEISLGSFNDMQEYRSSS